MDEEQTIRDKSADPGLTVMKDAFSRLDLVAMLVSQREFEALMKDDALEAVNLYSDASPVVGAELQGMIMDVHKADGEIEQVTLPGSLLQYGNTGWISKAIALLWSIHVIVGRICRFCNMFSGKFAP